MLAAVSAPPPAPTSVTLRFRISGTEEDAGTLDADPEWTLERVRREYRKKRAAADKPLTLLLFDDDVTTLVTKTPDPLSLCLRVRDFATTTVRLAFFGGDDDNFLDYAPVGITSFSPDGSWCVVHYATITVCCMKTGKSEILQSCPNCKYPIDHVDTAFFGDTVQFATRDSGHGDQLMVVHRAEDGTLRCRVERTCCFIRDIVATTPEGLVVGHEYSGENMNMLVGVDGEMVGELEDGPWCTDAAGRVLVLVLAEKLVTWSVVQHDTIVVQKHVAIEVETDILECGILATANGGVVTICKDGAVLYGVKSDPSTGAETLVAAKTLCQQPFFTCMSRDHRLIAFVDNASAFRVAVWDVCAVECVGRVSVASDVTSLSFADRGRVLVVSHATRPFECIRLASCSV
jgi:hypothetical protein